jgi:hypothetical protein
LISPDSKQSSSAEKNRRASPYRSPHRDASNIAIGHENTMITYKNNNYDKKSLKKRKIIDNLKLKEVSSMQTQLIKERERQFSIEKENQELLRQIDKKRTSLIDYANWFLRIVIVFLFAVIIYKNLSKILKVQEPVAKLPDQVPVESFTNE